MNQLSRDRKVRTARLAASAVAVAAVVAVAAGTAAGQAKPSYGDRAVASSHARRDFKAPKLKHGRLEIEGKKADDRIALSLKAGDPGILQVDVGDDGSPDFSFARAEISAIAVDAGRGDDVVRIDEANGTFTDSIPTTLDGGDDSDTIVGGAGASRLSGGRGDDKLLGGSGAETLFGGAGDDSIDGNRGADVAFMGSGDDTFVWDPGDGSDTVEGQHGTDTMLFNGANVAERVDLSANGDRLRFFRDAGSITMDTASVERVDFKALGGADVVEVGDLAGTDVRKLDVDLGAAGGGGDGQRDSVVVNGTARNDAVAASGAGGATTVTGLAPTVNVTNAEPASDALTINALGGDDVVTADGLAASSAALTVAGGDGNDVLTGGAGADRLFGDAGNDVLIGGPGLDDLDGGVGDNVLIQD
jgi:Ca2+-binding RTX toxin-like protein